MANSYYDTPVVFITGATGNLGGRLIGDLLTAHRGAQVVALVRAEDRRHADRRLSDTIRRLVPESLTTGHAARLQTVLGDVTRPRLGLSPKCYDELAGRVTHIIHAAANTQFHVSYTQAFSANCGGTRRMLEFARDAHACGRLNQYSHVSTAYVCGGRQGTIGEDELECGQSFVNAYEETKFEAERMVHGNAAEVPTRIFRPSIIVGDSVHGRTQSFQVLYMPLRLICDGLTDVLPGEPGATLDIVPLDYVSESILRLTLDDSVPEGETYHLVAGPDETATVDQIVRRAVSHFRVALPAGTVRYVQPEWWPNRAGGHLSRYVQRVLSLYRPYMSAYRHFDDVHSRSAGLHAPPVSSYLDRLLTYCADTCWGRQQRLAA